MESGREIESHGFLQPVGSITEACNLLFVTLRKSEEEYSPSRMYEDYVPSLTEFH